MFRTVHTAPDDQRKIQTSFQNVKLSDFSGGCGKSLEVAEQFPWDLIVSWVYILSWVIYSFILWNWKRPSDCSDQCQFSLAPVKKLPTHITHDTPAHLCNSTSNPPRKWKIDFDSETRVSHKSRNWATFQSEFISMSWRSMMSGYEEGEAAAVDWVMLAIRILSTTLKRNMFFNTPVDITLRCSFHLDYITKHV